MPGNGPFRSELEKQDDDLNIAARVSFHGWIDNETVEHLSFLRKAAIYISESRFEKCPRAVIETMASGCYPLLSDIEGHRQFFIDEPDPGLYLFSPDDEPALGKMLGQF